jgi:DNA replication protein DnaC
MYESVFCLLGIEQAKTDKAATKSPPHRLFLELTQAKADSTYHKLLKQLAKVRLLLIDD